MRLIDADYLTTEIARLVVGGKHAIEEAGHGNFWINGLYDVKEIIDSAPTVEYTFEEAFQKTVCEQNLYCPKRPQGDLIKAFELLKAHCKNRECNKDCLFYRELKVGDNTEQFCGLCEIVTSDD